MDYCCTCSVVPVCSRVCSRPSAFTSRRDTTSWLAPISRHVPCNKHPKFYFLRIPRNYRENHRNSWEKGGIPAKSFSTREGCRAGASRFIKLRVFSQNATNYKALLGSLRNMFYKDKISFVSSPLSTYIPWHWSMSMGYTVTLIHVNWESQYLHLSISISISIFMRVIYKYLFLKRIVCWYWSMRRHGTNPHVSVYVYVYVYVYTYVYVYLWQVNYNYRYLIRYLRRIIHDSFDTLRVSFVTQKVSLDT